MKDKSFIIILIIIAVVSAITLFIAGYFTGEIKATNKFLDDINNIERYNNQRIIQDNVVYVWPKKRVV